MAKSSRYVVVYDISNNRERSRASKILAGYGVRVQKSVFECRCTRGGVSRMRKALDELDLQTGFVLLYKMHENAKRKSAGCLPKYLSVPEPYALVI